MTLGERLKKIREERFPTAAAAARAIGINRFTYTQYENGTREVPRDAISRLKAFYNVSADWLLTGRGSARGQPKVPVVGYIGAGAEVYPLDDHAKGQGLEEVDAPPGYADCVAARIRGDSMLPLRNGWLVFWRRSQPGVPDDCLGELCVVQVKDGPMYCKDLRRGSRKGRFTLLSWNAPPLEDVAVEWAARVLDIRMRP